MADNVTTNFIGSNCDAICCVRNLVVLYEGEEFGEYLEYHAANYQLLNNHIFITLQDAENAQMNIGEDRGENGELTEGKSLLEYINNSERRWDGVVFPGHMMGALTKSDKLWDWNDFLFQEQRANDRSRDNSVQIQWSDIQPFYRSQVQQYGTAFKNQNTLISPSVSQTTTIVKNPDDEERVTLYAPLDGDVLTLFYRKDLFAIFNIKAPRTWEEYRDIAKFFHGKPLGPNNTPLIGSCIRQKQERCNSGSTNINAYLASLILSTMTQADGTKSGFLLSPEKLDPLLGDAMEETLRILEEQANFLNPIDLSDCDTEANNETTSEANLLLSDGNCAMTYDWANKLTATMMNAEYNRSNIGIARTPGSGRVLNRTTKHLETCTPKLCPYGIYYEDIGIVNRPLYSAFGGWMGGVSNDVNSANQHAMADFFAYLSNPSQSFQDVVPNQRSHFMSPFRYSHLQVSNWTDAGIDATTASQYTETVREVNSQNTVSEIRIEPGSAIRDILDQHVHLYLMSGKGIETWSGGPTIPEEYGTHNAALRSKITNSIDTQIREAISSLDDTPTVVKSYQSSLGYSKSFIEGESMNYIETQYRYTGWCTAIFICSMSIGIILWVIWNRNKKAMRAFQPFLNIQGAVGIFFMGITLVPLGFDEKVFPNTEVLDISCAVTPWIYTFGFSVFFSSIYPSIRWCLRILNHPKKYERILVRPIDSFMIFCPLFMLNGILLGLWTYLDPLKWQRREKRTNGPPYPSPDGTVETYGVCRSDDLNYHWFAMGLATLNVGFCLIAMLQALKCRSLVLDYHQMQWLQLYLFPIFEAWIACGPILPLLFERPTARYILLVVIIASSSIGSALVVFAPKEWYVRKNKMFAFEGELRKGVLARDSNQRPPSDPSPYGLKILKDPKVESLKQVLDLQLKLEHYKTSNTELAIDIRVLQETFRLLSGKKKLDAVKGIFSEEITNFQNSQYTAVSEDDWLGLSEFNHPEDFDALSMPTEEEDDENGKARSARTERYLSIFKKDEESQLQEAKSEVQEVDIENDETVRRRNVIPLVSTVTSSDSSRSGESPSACSTLNEISHLENSEIKFTPRLQPEATPEGTRDTFIEQADSSRSETSNVKVKHCPSVSSMEVSETQRTIAESESDEMEIASHSPNEGTEEKWDGDDDKAIEGEPSSSNKAVPIPGEDDKRTSTSGIYYEMGGLDEMIKTDDFEELESEARTMAETFKLNSTCLERISDLQSSPDLKSKGSRDNGVSKMSVSPSSATTHSISTSSVTTDNGSKGSTTRSDVQLVSPPQETADSKEEPDSSSSAGESSGATDALASERESENKNKGHSREQNAGEPSSDYSSQIETNKSGAADKVDTGDADAGYHGNGCNDVSNSLMPTEKSPQTSPTVIENGATASIQPSNSSISPSEPALLQEGSNSLPNAAEKSSYGSYSIGGWIARGKVGTLLAEVSDSASASASTSSYAESMTDSVLSMDFTKAPPVTKAVDKPKDNSDHDLVELYSRVHVDSAIDEEKCIQVSKLSATRQKKRELEALRNSWRSNEP